MIKQQTIYNVTILVPGDALPPEACHVGGKCVDLLGGQVELVLPGGHDAIPQGLGLFS